jgi:hypothetical protein
MDWFFDLFKEIGAGIGLWIAGFLLFIVYIAFMTILRDFFAKGNRPVAAVWSP